MFPNPLDEMNRMASQGCVVILGLLGLWLAFMWLFLSYWPFFVLALVAWLGWKVGRRYLRKPNQGRGP